MTLRYISFICQQKISDQFFASSSTQEVSQFESTQNKFNSKYILPGLFLFVCCFFFITILDMYAVKHDTVHYTPAVPSEVQRRAENSVRPPPQLPHESKGPQLYTLN